MPSKDNRTHYLDHKKWLASQVPAAKYNNTNVKLTKPRTLGFNFNGSVMKPKSPSQTWVIPKMNEPGPGSYNAPES